jgi:predicted phosphatase
LPYDRTQPQVIFITGLYDLDVRLLALPNDKREIEKDFQSIKYLDTKHSHLNNSRKQLGNYKQDWKISALSY